MSLDFTTIKNLISWPIYFIKEKIVRFLNENDKKIALLATTIFAALALSWVYKSWKKTSPISSSNEKRKTIDTKIENAAEKNLREFLDKAKQVKVPFQEKPVSNPSTNSSFEGEKDDVHLKKGKLKTLEGVWEIEGAFRLDGDALVGRGKIQFPKGIIFEGFYDKGVLRQGKLSYKEAGKVAKIDVEAGKPLTYDLEGEFSLKESLLNGKGKIIVHEPYNRMGLFEGTVEKGLMEGKGSFHGLKWVEEGVYKEGNLTGKTTVGKVCLEGTWDDEKFTGKVILPNGKSYEGPFYLNPSDGKGQTISELGFHIGTFVKGQMVEGMAMAFKEPDIICEGQFENRTFKKGKMSFGDLHLEGDWDAEKFIGKVTLPNGKVHEGQFEYKPKDGPGQSVGDDQLRVGIFANGHLVEGKIIFFGKPNLVYEVQNKSEGDISKWNVIQGEEIWELQLQEGLVIGKHTAKNVVEMGKFDDLNLLEGVAVNTEGAIWARVGYFGNEGRDLAFGLTRFEDGTVMLGRPCECCGKSVYYTDGSAEFGAIKDNALSIGVSRSPDLDVIEVGEFSEKELVQGLNYSVDNEKIETFGDAYAPKKINKKKGSAEVVEYGLFDQTEALKFGYKRVDQAINQGVFNREGFLVAGIKTPVTEGTFTSEGIHDTGRIFLDKRKLEGAFDPDEKKFFGKVTFDNTFEEGIFYQEDMTKIPVLRIGARKLASGIFEQGFFNKEGVLTTPCIISGWVK